MVERMCIHCFEILEFEVYSLLWIFSSWWLHHIGRFSERMYPTGTPLSTTSYPHQVAFPYAHVKRQSKNARTLFVRATLPSMNWQQSSFREKKKSSKATSSLGWKNENFRPRCTAHEIRFWNFAHDMRRRKTVFISILAFCYVLSQSYVRGGALMNCVQYFRIFSQSNSLIWDFWSAVKFINLRFFDSEIH